MQTMLKQTILQIYEKPHRRGGGKSADCVESVRLRAKETARKHCPKGATVVSAGSSDIAMHVYTTAELLSRWWVERATAGEGG